MPEMQMDPTELIKGFCLCFGFQLEDVREIHITPQEITIDYIQRGTKLSFPASFTVGWSPK